MSASSEKQLLHLVFGGELKDLESTTFADLASVDIVGIFPSHKCIRSPDAFVAQSSVDDASTRYFIAHLHRLLEPST